MVTRTPTFLPDRPQIELRNVSLRFAIHQNRHRSFQESFIRLLHRKKAPTEYFWPLRQVSLAVYPGDSVGVIGPNGTGKSSLLKLITGILNPTSGDLTVNGRISSLLELGAGFHPDLTGRENVYLNGSIYGISRAEMTRKIDSIVDYAELGEFIDTPIKHYSSGMYVRLGFAVAIHIQPDILLIDEVLAVGDANFQRKCLRSIQEYRNKGGSLMIVSHDLNTVQTVCDRAIWIENGTIQREGQTTDVVMAYLRQMAAKEESSKRSQEERHTSGDDDLHHWGNGRVRITQIELCDRTGQPRAVFHNGDSLTIRLHYVTDEVVEKPIFGLSIHHSGGAHICGPNTRFGELEIPTIVGAGVVSYTVPSLPLLSGDYAISVAVVNQNDTETYDFHDRTVHLSVAPGASQERYGLLTLNGRWGIELAGQ